MERGWSRSVCVHTHLHTDMQNVLLVFTLINEVFGSLGPGAVSVNESRKSPQDSNR